MLCALSLLGKAQHQIVRMTSKNKISPKDITNKQTYSHDNL